MAIEVDELVEVDPKVFSLWGSVDWMTLWIETMLVKKYCDDFLGVYA